MSMTINEYLEAIKLIGSTSEPMTITRFNTVIRSVPKDQLEQEVKRLEQSSTEHVKTWEVERMFPGHAILVTLYTNLKRRKRVETHLFAV